MSVNYKGYDGDIFKPDAVNEFKAYQDGDELILSLDVGEEIDAEKAHPESRGIVRSNMTSGIKIKWRDIVGDMILIEPIGTFFTPGRLCGIVKTVGCKLYTIKMKLDTGETLQVDEVSAEEFEILDKNWKG